MKLYLYVGSLCFYAKRVDFPFGMKSEERNGDILEGEERLSQMKHQLDVTLCRFYFCRVTLHVSGASAHHQEF